MSTSRPKPDLRFSVLALLALIGAGGWWLLDPAEDSRLAAITSASEQGALEELFMSGEHDQKPYWIGLNDELREGSFVWSSGERLSYQKWKSGEPNNFGGDEVMW